MVKQSLSIYYDSDHLDLKALLQELANREGSRFENRSMSEVARMVLEQALLSSDLEEAKTARVKET